MALSDWTITGQYDLLQRTPPGGQFLTAYEGGSCKLVRNGHTTPPNIRISFDFSVDGYDSDNDEAARLYLDFRRTDDDNRCRVTCDNAHHGDVSVRWVNHVGGSTREMFYKKDWDSRYWMRVIIDSYVVNDIVFGRVYANQINQGTFPLIGEWALHNSLVGLAGNGLEIELISGAAIGNISMAELLEVPA